MAGTSTTRAADTLGRRRSAGVYGAIVAASIFAAAGGHVRTIGLAVAVIVTLLVYWVAEEYAELLGTRAAQGEPVSRQDVRTDLADTWPMVSASFGPVVVLLVARLFGATDSVAADLGLGAAIVLLVGHAWSAGRAAHLTGRQLIMTTCTATLLGIAMVVLKHVVLVHFH